MKKNPNGYGGITKLSGNRRKPYLVYKSEMITEGAITSPSLKKRIQAKIDTLNNASDALVAYSIYINAISEIDEESRSIPTLDELKQKLENEIWEHLNKNTFKAKQKKITLGTYATRKEAQIALAKFNENPYDPTSKALTFKEVWEYAKPTLKLEHKAEGTQINWRIAFERCESIHDMPITDIKTVHLQQVIDSYSHLSARVLSAVKGVMAVVFAYAIQNDIVTRDYSKYVKITSTATKKKKKALKKDDVQLLWDNKDWQYHSPRQSLFEGFYIAHLLLLLVYTGMRIDELLTMQCYQVNLKENYFDCRGTKTDAAERLVPIHPAIKEIVMQHMGTPEAYLFSDRNGQPIKYSNFNNTAYAAFKRDMEFPYTFHECRHTFATYSLLKLDQQARAFIIGHADGITDEIYTHPELITDRLYKEMCKFSVE